MGLLRRKKKEKNNKGNGKTVEVINEMPSPRAEELEQLKELLAEAEAQESQMDFVDNTEQAKAILITHMLTNELEKLKQLSDLNGYLIPSLITLGVISKFLRRRQINAPTRENIYSEILTLMISHNRKGRQEFIDLGKGGASNLLELYKQMKGKYGNYM